MTRRSKWGLNDVGCYTPELQSVFLQLDETNKIILNHNPCVVRNTAPLGFAVTTTMMMMLTLAACGVQEEWTVLGFTPLALFLRHREKRLFRLPLSPLGREPLHLNAQDGGRIKQQRNRVGMVSHGNAQIQIRLRSRHMCDC